MSSLGTCWFLFVTVRPSSSDGSSQNPLLESHPLVRLSQPVTCPSGHRQALVLRRRPFRTSRCWNLTHWFDSPISPVVASSSSSGSSFWRRSRDALGALWLGCSLTIIRSSSSDDSPSSPLLESHPLVRLSLYVGVYHPCRQAPVLWRCPSGTSMWSIFHHYPLLACSYIGFAPISSSHPSPWSDLVVPSGASCHALWRHLFRSPLGPARAL